MNMLKCTRVCVLSGQGSDELCQPLHDWDRHLPQASQQTEFTGKFINNLYINLRIRIAFEIKVKTKEDGNLIRYLIRKDYKLKKEWNYQITQYIDSI